jgi:hypothetical protein
MLSVAKALHAQEGMAGFYRGFQYSALQSATVGITMKPPLPATTQSNCIDSIHAAAMLYIDQSHKRRHNIHLQWPVSDLDAGKGAVLLWVHVDRN